MPGALCPVQKRGLFVPGRRGGDRNDGRSHPRGVIQELAAHCGRAPTSRTRIRPGAAPIDAASFSTARPTQHPGGHGREPSNDSTRSATRRQLASSPCSNDSIGVIRATT